MQKYFHGEARAAHWAIMWYPEKSATSLTSQSLCKALLAPVTDSLCDPWQIWVPISLSVISPALLDSQGFQAKRDTRHESEAVWGAGNPDNVVQG